ncbi:MAG: DUF4384 domain-containing protein [candidate division Zixibacteria bacterium]|nr:DUF4384 domain-containing protein [candidate division Zixibacteria bacterium]
MKPKYPVVCAAIIAAAMAWSVTPTQYAGADVQMDARFQIIRHHNPNLQVSVWPDRGEGALYQCGDPISIHIEATRDCFLILYDIDTRGRLHILFPTTPGEDNFVGRGSDLCLPRPSDPDLWTVDGPPGIEYVQAVASEFPIAPPDWPVYLHTLDGSGLGYGDRELGEFRCGDDPAAYMSIINRRITGRYWGWCASDLATFQVVARPLFHINDACPVWPDEFYGAITIGWPVGARIYLDGIYVGIAPLRLAHPVIGHHVITGYDGRRMIRRHPVNLYPERTRGYVPERPREYRIRFEARAQSSHGDRPEWSTQRSRPARSDRTDDMNRRKQRRDGQ